MRRNTLLQDFPRREHPRSKNCLLYTSPDAIPGVVRGAAGLAPEPARRDSYASGLEMLFGKKWHGETPVSDHEALRLLDTYRCV